MSIEEMCRRLLQRAVDDDIIKFNKAAFVSTENPMQLTSGDLVGVTNLLTELLRTKTDQDHRITTSPRQTCFKTVLPVQK
jgi:hypothetical protein